MLSNFPEKKKEKTVKFAQKQKHSNNKGSKEVGNAHPNGMEWNSRMELWGSPEWRTTLETQPTLIVLRASSRPLCQAFQQYRSYLTKVKETI